MPDEYMKYIDEVMERAIREKVIAGMVTLVARHGEIVQFKGYGKAREGIPMQKDAIFRLASMSKPVGAAALMQLFDQGKVMPSDPLSMYLPEYADMLVAEPDLSGGFRRVPAKRGITVHDLLTMRSGLAAGRDKDLSDPAAAWCARAYEEAGIVDTMRPLTEPLSEVVHRLADMPLASHPGKRWDYSNLSCQVIGRIVELVSGQNLNDYLREHIFEPLDMKDTSFFPAEEVWDRIPDVYACGSGQVLKEMDVMGTDDTRLPYARNCSYYNMAAGLHGTAEDYFHFAQMLLDKGCYKGKRILSPNAVRLMTTNHIGTERTSLYGHAWGYMMEVEAEYNTTFNYMGIGSYGWHGYWGSVFNNWPKEDVTAIFLSQSSPVLPTWKVQERFLAVVANALAN